MVEALPRDTTLHLQVWAMLWHLLGRYEADYMVTAVLVPWLGESVCREEHFGETTLWLARLQQAEVASPHALHNPKPLSLEEVLLALKALLPPCCRRAWDVIWHTYATEANPQPLTLLHPPLNHLVRACYDWYRDPSKVQDTSVYLQWLPWVLACWLYPVLVSALSSLVTSPPPTGLPAEERKSLPQALRHYQTWESTWQGIGGLLRVNPTLSHWQSVWQSDTPEASMWRGIEAIGLIEGASEACILPTFWRIFEQAYGDTTPRSVWYWLPMGGMQAAVAYWKKWGGTPWFRGCVWMLLDGDIAPKFRQRMQQETDTQLAQAFKRSRAIFVFPEAHQLEDLYPLEALKALVCDTLRAWGGCLDGALHPSGESDSVFGALQCQIQARHAQERQNPWGGGRLSWWYALLHTLGVSPYQKLYMAQAVRTWLETHALSSPNAPLSSPYPAVTLWLWQQWQAAYPHMMATRRAYRKSPFCNNPL
jgi:hypothetical protein